MPKNERVSDHQLLDLVLRRPGATDAELGEALGLSRVQVSRRKHTPEFKQLVGEHFRDSFEVLRLAQDKAVRRICSAMDSPDDRVALKAAELILDHVPPVSRTVQPEELGESISQSVIEALEAIESSRLACP